MTPEQFLNGGKAKIITAQDFVGTGGFKIVSEEKPGLLGRIKGAFGERVDKAADAQLSNQSLPSKVLQTVGQGAGFVGDVVAEGVKAVVPDSIEAKVAEAVGAAATKVAGTAPAQAAIQQYQSWKLQHPEAAANLEATGLIASVLPMGKAAGAAGKATASGAIKAGEAAGKVKSATGQGIEATGQKIQQSVIRPSIHDVKDGFRIENVAKYDVGGSLPETITKSHAKMNELGQQLAAKLKGSDTKIKLSETMAKTAERLGADKAGTFGDNAALDRVLDQIADEVGRVGDDIDLITATNVKRGAGSKGAWAYNRPEADASAIERAYTEFYAVLKEQIEKAAPEGVREINKQLSELIPIQNAALRRLPVEQRNNVFSLTDSIGFMSALFDPKALLLVGASKAARSGKVGDMLTRTGQKMQGKKP